MAMAWNRAIVPVGGRARLPAPACCAPVPLNHEYAIDNGALPGRQRTTATPFPCRVPHIAFMPRPSTSSPPSHLPLLLAALAFLAALIVTYMVAGNAQRTAAAELAGNFDFRARDLAASVDRRMDVYEEVLLATRGYLRGAGDVDRAAVAAY